MRDLVKTRTAERLKTLNAELKHAIHKPKDADPVHDLRVSIRRLSRDLRVFQAWFNARAVKKIRRRLKKLMQRCAAVRNCDVAIDVLRAAGCQNPALEARLTEERRRTREKLDRMLERWRHGDRVRKWHSRLRVAHSDDRTELQGSTADHARRLLPGIMDGLFQGGREAARPRSSHYQMHQFRLQAKRVRYTLELFEPVYAPKTDPMMESLKRLQGMLGAINDCATTLEMIREDPAAVAAVERLAGEREAEFRRFWKQHFGAREKAQWKAVLNAADGNN